MLLKFDQQVERGPQAEYKAHFTGIQYIPMTEAAYKRLTKIKDPKIALGSYDGEIIYVPVEIERITDPITAYSLRQLNKIQSLDIYKNILETVKATKPPKQPKTSKPSKDESPDVSDGEDPAPPPSPPKPKLPAKKAPAKKVPYQRAQDNISVSEESD
jgi:hypothetical protein